MLPVLLALVAAAAAAFYSARHEVEEVYDAQLAHTAKVMLALMLHEVDEGEPDMNMLQERFGQVGHVYEKHIAVRIWQGDKLFYESESAKGFGQQHVIAGFSTKEISEDKWRFFVLPDAASGLTVEAAEAYDVRMDIIRKILLSMFAPAFILLLVIPPLFWFGLRRGLRPLEELSHAVSARSPDELKEISEARTPREILPLTQAINRLLLRLETALTKERQFTDLAAHELKTPLAVIKTLTQSAQRSGSDTERQALLTDLNAATDRANAMMNQLLALARLEQHPATESNVSLNETARTTAHEMMPLALHKHIELEMSESGKAVVQAAPEILAVAIRNLLDNAIKYTPKHGSIVMRVEKSGTTVQLSVLDSGLGIPPHKLSRVTERFYRVPGNEQTGAGLGLAIVSRAAEVMQAEFNLANREGGGLAATLTWHTQ